MLINARSGFGLDVRWIRLLRRSTNKYAGTNNDFHSLPAQPCAVAALISSKVATSGIKLVWFPGPVLKLTECLLAIPRSDPAL
jgi:hypothetical protein